MNDAAFIAVATVIAAIAVGSVGRKLVRRVIVHEFEAGLLYRNGRYVRRLVPGAYLVLTFRNEIAIVDSRKRVVTVPGQEVLSADSVGLPTNCCG